MKQILIVILGVLAAIVSFKASGQSSIAVTVDDVDTNKGTVILMLFNQEEGFPMEQDRAVKVAKLVAQKGQLTYEFKDLSPGTYALSFVHDANENDEVDRNFIGMPKERVGASNQTSFGKPNFKKSQFDLGIQEEREVRLTFLN